MLKKNIYPLFFTAILFVALFNVFFMLADTPLATWDESRHGVSAYEMLQSGNFLVNTYNLEPDYWNSKPILSFLPQIAGFEIFGPNAFGLRFFSAIAFILTLLCVARIAYTNKGVTFALFSSLIFVTSIRLITRHGARAGDADALFVLLYCLALLLILVRHPSYIRFYIACFVAGLAFLTKSFHAAPLCLTIIILYLMDMRISRHSFFNGLGCCIVAILPVGIWAILRYQYDGFAFFNAMLNDLLARSSTAIEGHDGGWDYYFIMIFRNFVVWIGALSVLFVACLIGRKQKGLSVFKIKDKFLLKLFIITLVPLCILTLSTSKLAWYMYAAYPFISILLASGLLYFSELITGNKPAVKRIIYILLVICFVASEVVVIKYIVKFKNSTRAQAQDAIYQLGQENKDNLLYLFGKDGCRQDLVLASKLYGNFILLPGGKEAFEKFEKPNKIYYDY